MRPRLKLFTGDDVCEADQPQVNVTLGEITGLLMDAAKWNRSWMMDFQDEDVKISADLYEILCAYSHLRPSA